MSLFIVIWTITAISVVAALYFQNSIVAKPNKNVILGVTIPFLQLNNKQVIAIINSFKKANKRLILYSLISFIPSYFNSYISIQMTYFFIWFAVLFYFSNKLYRKYNKQLRDLKRENDWMLPSKKLITIDTELTRLKDKMPVSFSWFIPSILLSMVPIAISYINKSKYGSELIITSFTDLMGVLIFMALYKIYVRKKSEVISEDSKINIACNKIYIRLWTAGTVIAALIHSVSMILVFLILSNVESNYWVFIAIITVTITIVLLGIFYINEKIRKEQNELISKTDSLIYYDNDEYWSTGFYINPNDRAVSVPDRAGYGMTFNLGNKKGKVTFWGMLLFALIIMVPVTFSSFRLDFGKVTMNITEKTITINAPAYGTTFNTNEIVEVSMVDKIPKGIRTNGAGAATYNIGNFNIDGYGKCKQYVYFENPNYICIKLKDESYIFINSKSYDTTMDYYNKLKTVRAN